MRFTKIVATIGPATNTERSIEELAKLGVNVFRLNFSHGDYAFHEQTIRCIRSLNAKGHSLAIMVDTKGPEVRTGVLKTPIDIREGDLVAFTPRSPTGKEEMTTIQVNYPSFAKDAQSAKSIVIDNGTIEMKLVKVIKDVVIAKAMENGKIGSRRHINLPGAHISLPSFTKNDWDDIAFGVAHDVDFFATSFIRSGDDIRKVRAFLRKKKSDAHIIAKIETPEAVKNIDDIIAESDGIMIARGDLGSEVPFEEVPGIQDELVQKCRSACTPVIVATHMLESMIEKPTPTRAEVTDIAFAAHMQADSTMLSGETASGKFPEKAVSAMVKVLKSNERIQPSYNLVEDIRSTNVDMPRREQALSACVLATKINADVIIVISKHGRTAKSVSNCRPLVPIHAFTDNEACQRRMMLLWGVTPYCIKLSDNPELTTVAALALLKKKGVLKKGQHAVAVSDVRSGSERIMTIQIRNIA